MHIQSKTSWLKHIDFLLIDIFMMLISFVLANLFYLKSLSYYASDVYSITILSIVLPLLFINVLYNGHSGILRRSNEDEFISICKFVFSNFITTILVIFLLKQGGIFSRVTLILTYLIYIILDFISRTIWKKLIVTGKVKLFSNKNRSLLVVCEENNCKDVLDNLNKESYSQYQIEGLCLVDKENKGEKIRDFLVLCNRTEIFDCVQSQRVDEVFFACKPNLVESEIVQQLIDAGVGIHLSIENIFNVEADKEYIDKVGIYKTLGLGLHTFTPNQIFYFFFKRMFDIVFSIIAMIPLSLLALIIKICYVISGDKASIFYTHTRVGKDGKNFQLYKFRSMVYNADEVLTELLKDEDNYKEWMEYHKLTNDPRITKIGKLLRKTSLDEFPQFINVLKGDMSIIGPRPLVVDELKMHHGLKLYEQIKPGITGWWACNGRSNISYKERLELEYYYVRNCSLYLDVLTFLRTIICVFKKTGAQ